jgi:hypothetical protein
MKRVFPDHGASNLKLLADQGDSKSQLSCAFLLFHGEGISMNKSFAAHYFKLSADQGNAGKTECLLSTFFTVLQDDSLIESPLKPPLKIDYFIF